MRRTSSEVAGRAGYMPKANTCKAARRSLPPLRWPPPLPQTSQPASPYFTPFSTLFPYSILSHNCPKTHPKRGSKKRQKSQKSIKDHSLNLAWKSCLQKEPPKCDNHTPFQRFKPISKVPRYPKKPPKLNPKLTLKL